MENLDEIIERIHESFEARTHARDDALKQARTLTRHCANAIRAVHRNDDELAEKHLGKAGGLAQELRSNLQEYPDFYFAGYKISKGWGLGSLLFVACCLCLLVVVAVIMIILAFATDVFDFEGEPTIVEVDSGRTYFEDDFYASFFERLP